MEKQQLQRKIQKWNPRLTESGEEKLDPKPKVVYAKINYDTGEIIREGVYPPKSVQENLELATSRSGASTWDDGDDQDDDFNLPDQNPDRIPTLSPHQEGFVDANAPSIMEAAKILQKRGYSIFKPADAPPTDPEPAAPAKTNKQTRAPKAGESSTPPADAAE